MLRPSRALERKNKTGDERIVVLHGGIGPAPKNGVALIISGQKLRFGLQSFADDAGALLASEATFSETRSWRRHRSRCRARLG